MAKAMRNSGNPKAGSVLEDVLLCTFLLPITVAFCPKLTVGEGTRRLMAKAMRNSGNPKAGSVLGDVFCNFLSPITVAFCPRLTAGEGTRKLVAKTMRFRVQIRC
jgi:hypothetical protein